jgi:hypothetical protein
VADDYYSRLTERFAADPQRSRFEDWTLTVVLTRTAFPFLEQRTSDEVAGTAERLRDGDDPATPSPPAAVVKPDRSRGHQCAMRRLPDREPQL